MAHNFNHIVEIKGLLKVTGTHVHSKSGTIWDIVQYRDITKGH